MKSIIRSAFAALTAAALVSTAYAQDDEPKPDPILSGKVQDHLQDAIVSEAEGLTEKSLSQLGDALNDAETPYDRFIIQYYRALRLDKMRRYEEAVAATESAFAEKGLSDGLYQALYGDYGRRLLEVGREAEAATALETSLKTNQPSAEVLRRLTRIYYHSGNSEKALGTAKRALVIAHREDPEDYGAVAHLFEVTGDNARQQALLKVGEKRWPGLTSSWGYLAQDWKELKPVESKIPVYPSTAWARGIGGYCEMKADVQPDGRTANVRVTRCSHAVFANDSVKAVEGWRYDPAVIAGHPLSKSITTSISYNVGQYGRRHAPGVMNRSTDVNRLLQEGKTTEAIGVIDLMLGRLYGDTPEIFTLLRKRGDLLSQQGKEDAAMESWERALAFDSSLVFNESRADVLTSVARVYLKRGEAEKAADYIASDRKSHPYMETEPMLSVQALAMARSGNLEAALPIAERAIEIASPKEQRHFALAYTLYTKAEQPEKAADIQQLLAAYASQPVTVVEP